MALTIKNLLEQNLFPDMRLVAGQEGIGNAVTWVNVMEILDTPDSVKKGELLITTGFDLTNYEKYKNIISRLKSRGVPGMAIQLGYYIDRVPDYIIRAADYYQFPVLDLPSRYSFSEILHITIDALNRYLENTVGSSFDCDYFLGELKKRLHDAPEMFSSRESKYLFCISAANASSAEKTQLQSALDQIRSFLTARTAGSIYDACSSAQAVYCLSLLPGYDLHAVAYDLQIQLTFLSEQQGIDLYVGIDEFHTPGCLHSALHNAGECVVLLNTIEAKRGVCSFDDYTFIQMFGTLYHNNHSFVLENQALQNLLSRDRKNHTNYVQTLRIYLAENCNTTHAAARLFIHRHTLINRLQTIRDLCGIDFNNYYSRIYLTLALLVHDYYAI